jgi:protein-L-isoaspartate(D-aspartate) O-methyltransferase
MRGFVTVVLSFPVVVAFALGSNDPSSAASGCSRDRAKPSPVELRRADVPTDSKDDQARRNRLVDSIAASGVAKSPRVLDALRKVPRHLFPPDAPDASRVAEMTEALDVQPENRVLEIGTGSGYETAVLSMLAHEVWTIESNPELGDRARKRFAELGYPNVDVLVGDPNAGWKERAPFDRIILAASPPEVPERLVDQLAEGGILVALASESLVRIRKNHGEVTRERIDSISRR